MKELNSARPQLEQRPQREGKASNAIQSEYMTERPKWELSEQRKDVSGKRMQQRWEAQWQEFLKTLQSPYSACGNLQLSETTPWDDTKAFLASFEQVAEACRWPRGEWVIRLLPALSGEAEQAFQNMESTDQEDYGKVKAAILRADALRVEVQRQHFRQFCCQEVEDPRRIHCQLQELCHQWLKPDRHSKEQILELLILEQFLVSLPPDLQNWIRARGPDSCSQAVALVEDFLMTQQEAVSAKWQKPLQDVCVGSLEVEEVQSDAAEGQVCKEAKQADDAEITLLGNGIKCSNHSSSLLPPEGQEVTEARLSEGLLNLKETGVSLHMVEQTLTQPGQQTIFWQVLQEDGGNVQPFGGDGKATPLKVENPQHGGNELVEMPMAMPVMNQEKLPRMAEKKHKERCDKSRYWIKMEKSQQGEIVPEETQKVLAETIPWNFPVTAESHDRRRECKGQQEKRPMEREQDCSEVTESLAGDKKRNPIKMENAQQGEMRPDEIHRTCAETTKGNFVAVEILGQRWEPEGQQRENPVRRETACTELAKGLTGAVSQTSTMYGTEEMPSFLQDEEGYSCRSGYVMHSREDSYECPIGLKHFPEVSCFDKNQGLKVREKENEVSEYIKKENLMGCPSKLSDDDSVSEKEKEGSVQQEGPRRELSEERYTEERCCIRHLMAVHSGAPLFECSNCGKGFTKQKDFIGHQMTDHTENNGDMCPDSGTSDREKMSLVKHQTPHMGEFSCKDPNCTDNFEDNRIFVSHCRMNEKEQPHQHLDHQMHFLEGSNPEGYVGTCSECGKCFRNERCFVNPQRMHMQEQSYKQEGEEEPLPANQTNQLNMKREMCFDCEKLICTNLVLAEPKTEIEQDFHICPDCGKTFQDSRCFANHQRIHGKEQNKKESQQEAYGEEVLPSEERCYQCPTCKRAYSTRYNLRRHQQIHTECKSNKRSSLGKRSSCKWSFSENQNAQGKGEHQYKCSYCGKAFKVKGSLCKHQKIHIKDKPYKCNVCGKAFAYRYTLAYHQESHIKEQMYQHKCSYCRKTFSMQSYLRRHQQLHMGSKPYSCGVCGKAFAYRYALTRHQEIHVEGPSQKCSFCWKAFRTNYSLSRHKRIHMDTRSYQCSICGKVFGRKYSLFRHQDMHEKRSSGNMSSSGKDPSNSLNTVKDEAGTPEKNSNIWPDSSTFAGNQGVQKDGEIPENPEGIGSSRCTKNQNTHLGENPALGLAPERLS